MAAVKPDTKAFVDGHRQEMGDGFIDACQFWGNVVVRGGLDRNADLDAHEQWTTFEATLTVEAAKHLMVRLGSAIAVAEQEPLDEARLLSYWPDVGEVA